MPTTSNRTNNRGGNWQQQAWNNMQQAPYCSPAFNAMPNTVGKTQPIPYRAFKNQNYCFIHCHHIENDHTIQTCKTPGPNHNPNAAKFNTMDGSNARAHKTIMPPQCGRQPCTRSKREPGPNYLQWRTAGFPPRPNNRRQGGGRQQQNQMTMPTMIGQPTMMNMAGGMPGNIQKPMANLNMEIILMNFWDMARGTGT